MGAQVTQSRFFESILEQTKCLFSGGPGEEASPSAATNGAPHETAQAVAWPPRLPKLMRRCYAEEPADRPDFAGVLDVLDSLEDYAPAVAVACLTRCVKALMDEEAADGEIAPERALRGACNALRANARANHQHRELCVAAPTPTRTPLAQPWPIISS